MHMSCRYHTEDDIDDCNQNNDDAADEDDDVEGQVRRRHRARLEENAPLAGDEDGEGEDFDIFYQAVPLP